jgi:hypothetical protein
MVVKILGVLLVVMSRLHQSGVPWAKMAIAFTLPGAAADAGGRLGSGGTRASAASTTLATAGTVVATSRTPEMALPTTRFAALTPLPLSPSARSRAANSPALITVSDAFSS